jgi:hypothetical protein
LTQRKAPRKRTRLDLFSGDPAGSSPDAADARRRALRDFVERLRTTYSHLWPANANARSFAKPWPDCWEEHTGLVADLQYLKDWAAALAAGDIEGDAYGARDSWRRYVHTLLVDDIRAISGRTCRYGHVDPTKRAAESAPDIPSAPPLPGQVQPASRAPAHAASLADWVVLPSNGWHRLGAPNGSAGPRPPEAEGPDLS